MILILTLQPDPHPTARVRTHHLLRSTALAFGTLMVGYALMTVAPGIVALLPAVVVRSLGAATLWVYSTLLLQYRVENRIQGGSSK
jgi:hypothetical protein